VEDSHAESNPDENRNSQRIQPSRRVQEGRAMPDLARREANWERTDRSGFNEKIVAHLRARPQVISPVRVAALQQLGIRSRITASSNISDLTRKEASCFQVNQKLKQRGLHHPAAQGEIGAERALRTSAPGSFPNPFTNAARFTLSSMDPCLARSAAGGCLNEVDFRSVGADEMLVRIDWLRPGARRED